jgi:translation initiation factor 1
MSMSGKPSKNRSRQPAKLVSDAAPLTSNPFAGLAALLPNAPAGPEPAADPTPPITDAAAEPSPARGGLAGRLIVRRQKKGQGGKTVTCIEGLDPPLIPELLTRLKRDLGCSGRLDSAVLIAGTADHQRVATWLRKAGATQVVIGN